MLEAMKSDRRSFEGHTSMQSPERVDFTTLWSVWATVVLARHYTRLAMALIGAD